MSRSRSHRLRIAGTLEAVAPLHVGSMEDSLETDMPLAHNGRGKAYIPGTAFAGPLRAWTRARFAQIEELLWGFQLDGDGNASRVYVEDAVVQSAIPYEIWDSVGIDREYATAAAGVKFDRAVLPKGTILSFDMSVELPTEAQAGARARAVVGHLLGALSNAQIGVGAAGTRGLGRCRLLEPIIHDEDWSSKEGILDFLADQSPTTTIPALVAADPAVQPTERSIVRIDIDWTPAGPVMSKAAFDGVAVDTLPFISACDGETMAMVLPGSGLKGVLRTHAERIVRTVLGNPMDAAWRGLQDRRQRHLAQVQVPLVQHLFGSAKRGKGTGNRPAGRGTLEVDACYATAARLRRDAWEALAQAKQDEAASAQELTPLYKRLNEEGLLADPRNPQQPYFEQAFHVAVDRWTGGAAEGLLFNAIEPFNITWDPIRLTLDLSRLPEECRDAALALLLLLTRDLASDRIPLGFGSNRGYGSVEVREVRVQSEGTNYDWINGAVLPSGDVTKLDRTRLKALQQAWRAWADEESTAQAGE